MTEGSETGSGSTVNNSSNTITAPILNGQLFGPFYDPLQWLAFRCSSSVCGNDSNSSSNDLFSSVDIARNSEEQNMEIVHRNGQFYFRAIHDIQCNNSDNEKTSLPKLLAWFSEELNAKLPTPSSSTINGSKRYFCALCNEVFLYPNSVVIHLLYNCPKRIQIEAINTHDVSKISPPISTSTTTTTISASAASTAPIKNQPPKIKKRGFDIASLVNEESNDSSCSNKRPRNGVESDSKAEEDAQRISSSAFHHPKSPPSIRHPSLSSSTFENAVNSQTSAFKKVDQKSNSLANPYDFSSLYHRVAAASALMPSSAHPTSLIPSLSMPTSLPTPLTTTGSKSLVSSTLLPYLPPSLAALTFPTSNWCAKCNATFRMTSDLVYHMRSHHKNVTAVDPLKKKREEKLRCNICQETFRERHHLTRHMTSHQ